jgi:hypothetical protein
MFLAGPIWPVSPKRVLSGEKEVKLRVGVSV